VYRGLLSASLTLAAPRHTVKARKEITLSAGSFNTPQLLMLSGIGDAPTLKQLGIEPIVDCPDVGANINDHPYIIKPFISPHTTESHEAWRKAEKVEQYTQQWVENAMGPLTSSIANHVAFLRLPEDDEVLAKYGDPSAGPTSAHFEYIFVVTFISSG
jgi:choline dehydrogenase-like flavoprotein